MEFYIRMSVTAGETGVRAKYNRKRAYEDNLFLKDSEMFDKLVHRHAARRRTVK